MISACVLVSNHTNSPSTVGLFLTDSGIFDNQRTAVKNIPQILDLKEYQFSYSFKAKIEIKEVSDFPLKKYKMVQRDKKKKKWWSRKNWPTVVASLMLTACLVVKITQRCFYSLFVL